MVTGQSPSPEGQLRLNNSPPNAVRCIHCFVPLVQVSTDPSRASAGLSQPSPMVSQGSGRKGCLLPPSSSLKSLSPLSSWASILTSDPCWVPGTHFRHFSLHHITVFQCLDINSQRGNFSAAHHPPTSQKFFFSPFNIMLADGVS